MVLIGFGLEQFGCIQFGLVNFDLVWYGLFEFDLVEFGVFESRFLHVPWTRKIYRELLRN